MLFWGHQPAKKRKVVPSNEVLDKSRGAVCLGNDCLTNFLTSYAATKQNEAVLKVGVVGKLSSCFLENMFRNGCSLLTCYFEDLNSFSFTGFPNVGKSSLINSLKGMLACHVGADRGTTK